MDWREGSDTLDADVGDLRTQDTGRAVWDAS